MSEDDLPAGGSGQMDRGDIERDGVVKVIGGQPEPFRGATYRNTTIVRFEGTHYPVSHRAVLTLVTVAACNAACRFCSNEVTFTPRGPYLRHGPSLQGVLRFTHLAGTSKIAFTGGEPTLRPQAMYDLAQATIPGFTTARLHTNGSGILSPVRAGRDSVPLLDALIQARLTGVSVSVASADSAVNRAVMNLGPRWGGLSDAELRDIATRRRQAFTPRLSCVLTTDAVATPDQVLRYVDWGWGLGFRHFVFRSASGIPERFAKTTGFAAYNAAAHLEIHPLTDALANRPDWRERFAQHKSDSHVHIYDIGDGGRVEIDDSSEEEDHDDKIRRLTVMPNGVLYKSWIDPNAVVFATDRDRAQSDAARELPHLQVAAATGPAGAQP
jgi:molybdenum cofactor biosynthesis enzyme MoaA